MLTAYYEFDSDNDLYIRSLAELICPKELGKYESSNSELWFPISRTNEIITMLAPMVGLTALAIFPNAYTFLLTATSFTTLLIRANAYKRKKAVYEHPDISDIIH